MVVQNAWEGSQYYICRHCERACDAIESKQMSKDTHNDARNDAEIA